MREKRTEEKWSRAERVILFHRRFWYLKIWFHSSLGTPAKKNFKMLHKTELRCDPGSPATCQVGCQRTRQTSWQETKQVSNGNLSGGQNTDGILPGFHRKFLKIVPALQNISSQTNMQFLMKNVSSLVYPNVLTHSMFLTSNVLQFLSGTSYVEAFVQLEKKYIPSPWFFAFW